MTLLQVSFVLFAAIAAGGLLFLGMILMGLRVPPILGMGHGLGALAALAVLCAADLLGRSATPPAAWWAFVVFLSGFVGGLLFFRVLFKVRAPAALAALHGSIGVVGLYLLYGAAFAA